MVWDIDDVSGLTFRQRGGGFVKGWYPWKSPIGSREPWYFLKTTSQCGISRFVGRKTQLIHEVRGYRNRLQNFGGLLGGFLLGVYLAFIWRWRWRWVFFFVKKNTNWVDLFLVSKTVQKRYESWVFEDVLGLYPLPVVFCEIARNTYKTTWEKATHLHLRNIISIWYIVSCLIYHSSSYIIDMLIYLMYSIHVICLSILLMVPIVSIYLVSNKSNHNLNPIYLIHPHFLHFDRVVLPMR